MLILSGNEEPCWFCIRVRSHVRCEVNKMRITIRGESETAGCAIVILGIVRLHIAVRIVMALVAGDRDIIGHDLAQMIVMEATSPLIGGAAHKEVCPGAARAVRAYEGQGIVASEAEPVYSYWSDADAIRRPRTYQRGIIRP